MSVFRKYSTYLQEKYGEKVYKLSINLPLTCPNRNQDNLGGCTFCADVGTGFSSAPSIDIPKQLEERKEIIKKRYKAKKYIAYFQNYTNTYMPLETFQKYILSALVDDVVEIDISTRPDCITDEQLEFLAEVKRNYQVEVTLELGLQTVNYKTLDKIRRGHGLAEFIDGILRIKKFGFEVCVHLILNLPWDDDRDVIENAKILSALKVEQVKLHALYVMDHTQMGEAYKKGEFEICTAEEYQQKVITFLRHLDPEIVVQRLLGRAPRENSLFVNWNQSWWKIRDNIEETMEKNGMEQGDFFHYLGGRAYEQEVEKQK
ncbi:TIGR01212 family radical SAM protein [Isachenkonia alkalipeptolytica]|uniref:TIGR01212 family radical SAM protein n=1 Tax=Isachenkonia alkalipeptolytica TaxID=2565777 RepID=A0AA44BEH6_9CLOT|nr:TIGR01212 family radical SAM protein [Isachenkonia alkalipeptolytica]NBG89294.1 TIGR01212 family radical SAM protein [Isachenkonia alkalipeptolytica]